jgi:hypothetical protein
MKKYLSMFCLLLLLGAAKAEAQYGTRIYVRPGYARPHRVQRRPARDNFQPSVNISIGYGFPNLDKNALIDFTNAYRGNTSQTGPIHAAIDYQFSRYMSIGVMGSYSKATVPYYDIDSYQQAFTGKVENWSIMLNLVNYFPTYNRNVSPYLRTAIGVNNWTQDYSYPDGSKVANVLEPSQFAYQASLGAKFKLSPNAGLYLEAGYGKYILAGGLTFKF